MATVSSGNARRVNRGKGHSYTLDGKPVLGVTTILNKAMPKPALVPWAAREVAEFVCSRREILTQLTDEELVDLCKGAPFRERDRAANRGTEVHRLAEQLARGLTVDVPQELAGHVDSYLAFLEEFEPSEALLERPIFNRHYRYAGTLDLLCAIAGAKVGIKQETARCLLDLKTNRSGPFGEVALQMAAYGNAEVYVDGDGFEHAMPPIDFFGALWVRADGFDLYPYDVTDREWKQFLFCAQTAWWVDQRMDHVRRDAIFQRQEVAV